MNAKPVVHRFDDWGPSLENALATFEDDPDWPRDLYSSLVAEVPTNRRSLFLWLRNDEPVAILGLYREDDGSWCPVTNWILPGWIGPIRSAQEWPSLLANLDLPLRVGWWRMTPSHPSCEGINNATVDRVVATHRMSCDEDFEAFWKRTGQLRSITRARHRCERFSHVVNAEDAPEWVVSRCDELWSESGGRTLHGRLKLVTARELAGRGRTVSFSLWDNDRLVAADLALVHRATLVCKDTARDREYDAFGVGIRSLELMFWWAKSNGLDAVDIGGGFDYKARWAPEEGSRSTLVLQPERSLSARFLQRGQRVARSLRKRLAPNAAAAKELSVRRRR